MSKMDCDIIRDMLPLYIDEVCSKKTFDLVKTHLDKCAECNAYYTELKSPVRNSVKYPVDNRGTSFLAAQNKILGFICAILVIGIGIGMNFSAMFYGDRTLAVPSLVSISYIVFWLVFTYTTRNFKSLQKLSLTISSLSIVSAIILVLSTQNLEGSTAYMLINFLLIPLHGLRIFGNSPYVIFAFLAVWAGLALYNLLKQGELNLFNQISKKIPSSPKTVKRNISVAALVTFIYAVIYLLSRTLLSNMYTPEWTSRNFLLVAAIITIIPVFFKAHLYPFIALSGYVLGVILGELFGRTTRVMQKGLPPMPVHNGWFICIVTFLAFAAVGVIVEIIRKKKLIEKTKRGDTP